MRVCLSLPTGFLYGDTSGENPWQACCLSGLEVGYTDSGYPKCCAYGM